MLSAAEIRNTKFTKAMGGYKQEEVDILLDKIEADYAAIDRAIKEYQTKIENLNKEIESLKASQSSIQNVLLSAQKLADQIVDEAKAKSEEIVNNAESNISLITAREKELSTTFELKAQERKNKLEKELSDMVKTAQIKADSIKAATEDSISRQQVLFDKLRMEVVAFKAGISAKYKEHLEILQTLPDTVPMDPSHIAEIVAAEVDKAPNPETYIKDLPVADTVNNKNEVTAPDNNSDEINSNAGFKIKDEADF